MIMQKKKFHTCAILKTGINFAKATGINLNGLQNQIVFTILI